MNKEVLDIISAKETFPCKLKKQEGETLKKNFQVDESFILSRKNREHLDDLEFKYLYEDEGTKYTLLEEFLFKENSPVLDVHSAIGVNYYLNKVTTTN